MNYITVKLKRNYLTDGVVMNVLNLKSQLNLDRKPLYIIKGNDSYLRRTALKSFQDLIDGFAKDLNVNYFQANAMVEDVVNALNTPSFMSDIRLVIWYGDNKKINADLAKSNADAIKKYLQNPNPNVILVLFDENEYFKSCYKLGEPVDCEKLETSQLMKITNDKIELQGYTATNDSVKEIVIRSDNDMETINNGLTKIFAYAIDNKVIDINVVDECITNNAEQDVFNLSNFIALGKVDETYRLLENLIMRGQAPLMLLALITAHFRRMFLVRVSKLSDESLGKLVGSHPYAIKKARETATKFKPMRLKKILDELQSIEFDCKQGKLNIDDGLQKAVCIALSNNM